MNEEKTMQAVPAVSCFDLRKSYGGPYVLSGVNLELPSGKIIGLLGPNGNGKTTLIKILAGLLQPSSGQALIYGEEPGDATKAIVSYLPERTYFDAGMRVRECVRFFEDFYADFDSEPLEAKIKTLSKGTREKVQLILVMARRAKLYLLDEPIGGVDPAAREYILNTIINYHAPDATVIISTHLICDVEEILDGFVFVGGGGILMSGDVNEVRREHGKSLDEIFREVFRCY